MRTRLKPRSRSFCATVALVASSGLVQYVTIICAGATSSVKSGRSTASGSTRIEPGSRSGPVS